MELTEPVSVPVLLLLALPDTEASCPVAVLEGLIWLGKDVALAGAEEDLAGEELLLALPPAPTPELLLAEAREEAEASPEETELGDTLPLAQGRAVAEKKALAEALEEPRTPPAPPALLLGAALELPLP